MFGYRLIKEKEYQKLLADLDAKAACIQRIDEQNDVFYGLLETVYKEYLNSSKQPCFFNGYVNELDAIFLPLTKEEIAEFYKVNSDNVSFILEKRKLFYK